MRGLNSGFSIVVSLTIRVVITGALGSFSGRLVQTSIVRFALGTLYEIIAFFSVVG